MMVESTIIDGTMREDGRRMLYHSMRVAEGKQFINFFSLCYNNKYSFFEYLLKLLKLKPKNYLN
jgi:hypothetical protein